MILSNDVSKILLCRVGEGMWRRIFELIRTMYSFPKITACGPSWSKTANPLIFVSKINSIYIFSEKDSVPLPVRDWNITQLFVSSQLIHKEKLFHFPFLLMEFLHNDWLLDPDNTRLSNIIERDALAFWLGTSPSLRCLINRYRWKLGLFWWIEMHH